MTITNGLITRADFEQFTTYTPSGTDRQAQEDMVIETASRWIEAYCGRQFYDSGSASIRYFDIANWRARLVHIDDCQSVTLVRADYSQDGSFGTTFDPTWYQLLPVGGRDPVLGAVSYTSVQVTFGRVFPTPIYRDGLVEVTARWGWSAVPTPVKRACALIALDLLRGPEAAFGTQVGDFGILRVKQHPQAAMLLDPFVRGEIAVGIA